MKGLPGAFHWCFPPGIFCFSSTRGLILFWTSGREIWGKPCRNDTVQGAALLVVDACCPEEKQDGHRFLPARSSAPWEQARLQGHISAHVVEVSWAEK